MSDTRTNEEFEKLLDLAAARHGLRSRSRALSLDLDVAQQSICCAMARGGLSPRLVRRALLAFPTAGLNAHALLSGRLRDPLA